MVLRFAWLLLLSLPVCAQQPDLTPRESGRPAVPTIVFAVSWDAATPPWYAVSVDAVGSAAYEAIDHLTPQPGDRYTVKFTISETTRTRLFALAQELDFFQGDFDFKKHKVAFTGTKTLTYADRTRRIQTTYVWSENPGLQEVTDIFIGIANTQNSARRLAHLRRFDRLGLEPELKAMERSAQHGYLREVQAIAPLLCEIANDHQVMNVSRQRARRLLQLAETTPPKPAPGATQE